MTLVLQNDAGTVEDANAYIDYAYFMAYHSARGATPTQSRSLVEKAIIRATEHIDLGCEPQFPGRRLTGYGQATAFPRDLIFQDDGRTPITGLPATLKKATAELTLRALSGALTQDQAAGLSDQGGVTRYRSKVGQIEEETEYSASSVRAALRSPQVAMLLRPLCFTTSGGTYR